MQTLSEIWREMQENTTTSAIRSTAERDAIFDFDFLHKLVFLACVIKSMIVYFSF